MKNKSLVAAAIMSIMVSGAAAAAGLPDGTTTGTPTPAQALVQWTGFVPGVFNTSEIALTGQGGGDIVPGLLAIDETGTFTSERAVVVEAHASEELVEGSGEWTATTDAYAGDVDWTLTGVGINNAAYDVGKLAFQVNGNDILPLGSTGTGDTSFKTEEGSGHILGVTVSYDEVADVTAGDSVQVSATVLAQPAVA
ncbi:hypothetical protein HPX47_004642 [Vibrio alginolyticus]|nr:hypothetical protein [Vibrio alginolyticus]